MTLLESLVALVVLGLSALGFLELFQQVAARTAATAGRAEVLAIAEATMERALSDRATLAPALRDSAGYRQRLDVQPHPTGLLEVVVTVEHARDGRVTLHRLVAR
ncbi:MAG: type II secretion system protein [Gemmatimonadaceae bacterium]|nr:type II secretion system protein [Gemmatimonadaceae bacterium]